MSPYFGFHATLELCANKRIEFMKEVPYGRNVEIVVHWGITVLTGLFAGKDK